MRFILSGKDFKMPETDFTNPTIKRCLHLGLCCKNTELAKRGINAGRTMIRKNYTPERAMEVALKNLNDLKLLLEYNWRNGIKCFRIGSDIFPHFTDKMCTSYSLDFAKTVLGEIGEMIAAFDMRVVMHPGQYNQIGALDPRVFESTVRELTYHCDMLDLMNVQKSGVLIIHGGGVYGCKETTIKRWISQFFVLPQRIRKRIVLENCENCYNIEDCLEIANACGIPVVLDFFHYTCWEGAQRPVEEYIPRVVATWDPDIAPIMHISEQAPNSKKGKHSFMIEKIPSELFDYVIATEREIHLEVEAKGKELAVNHLYKKYNGLPKIRIMYKK
jgi:UV DNA damage endonuclease